MKRGGWPLTRHKSSLSLTFLLLFLASAWLYAKGAAEVMSIKNLRKGEAAVSSWTCITTSRFWFESFQNWQSGLVSIVFIVGLSSFLRQQGLPRSKPVDAPHRQTGAE